MRTTLRIGTRASLLAVTQSTWVKTRIEQAHPQVRVELVQITTKGDRILDVPLAKVGGKGLFVKEIEDALLDGTADLAVHSMKDVPTELPEGLFIGIVPARETPLDAYISNRFATLEALPVGARVGTSSLRRKSQLAAVRPDLTILDLRGNVDTRLRKLDEGQYEAIILAGAGLNRLGLQGGSPPNSTRRSCSRPSARARSALNCAATTPNCSLTCNSSMTPAPPLPWPPNGPFCCVSRAAARCPLARTPWWTAKQSVSPA